MYPPNNRTALCIITIFIFILNSLSIRQRLSNKKIKINIFAKHSLLCVYKICLC